MSMYYLDSLTARMTELHSETGCMTMPIGHGRMKEWSGISSASTALGYRVVCVVNLEAGYWVALHEAHGQHLPSGQPGNAVWDLYPFHARLQERIHTVHSPLC